MQSLSVRQVWTSRRELRGPVNCRGVCGWLGIQLRNVAEQLGGKDGSEELPLPNTPLRCAKGWGPFLAIYKMATEPLLPPPFRAAKGRVGEGCFGFGFGFGFGPATTTRSEDQYPAACPSLRLSEAP